MNRSPVQVRSLAPFKFVNESIVKMNQFKTHGAISWSELMTNDATAAAKFYSDVFGWRTEVMPMPTGEYTVANIGDAAVAGIMKKPEAEMPVVWAFYVTVDDVDETVKQAEGLGATVVVPTMEVPTVGRFAGLQDPQGAYFMVMTYAPTETENAVDFVKSFSTHGAFSWYELRTPDPAAAMKFYSELFGWNSKSQMMGPAMEYHTISVGEVGIGGACTPPQKDIPPHWGAYVTVDDIEATAQKIKECGGTLMMEPMDIPEVGRFTMFTDPQGGALAAITYVSELTS